MRKSSVIVSVIWIKPPINWIKINTDGAALGAPSMSGAGGIFCDHNGSVIFSFAAPLGSYFSFEVELTAVIIGLFTNLW